MYSCIPNSISLHKIFLRCLFQIPSISNIDFCFAHIQYDDVCFIECNFCTSAYISINVIVLHSNLSNVSLFSLHYSAIINPKITRNNSEMKMLSLRIWKNIIQINHGLLGSESLLSSDLYREERISL